MAAAHNDKELKKPLLSLTKPFFRNDPIVSIALLILIFFASQLIAALLVSLYPAVHEWTDAQSRAWLADSVAAQFLYILIAEAIAVSSIFWVIKGIGVTKRRLGLIRPRFSDVGWALIAYGLYFLCLLVAMALVRWLAPSINLDQEQKIGFGTAENNIELFATFLSLVVLVPIAEEIMFRGFLFSSLRAKYRFWISTILTSLVFGIAHLQFGADAPLLWAAAIDTFLLSAFLCYLREQQNSLWPAIFLHAIKNSVAFIFIFGSRFIY